MKRFAVFSMLIAGFMMGANAAVPSQRRGQSAQTNTSGAAATKAASARSAVSARSASAVRTAPAAAPARAAVAGRANVVSRNQTASTGTQTVAARAGATQKVIGTGTKVAAATKNVVVSEACQQKYEGCMDSFCMIDNDTGGRCICSDKNAELDSILAEIEKLDQQSYQMATTGVERIEMGADANAVIANANAIAQSLSQEKAENSVSSRRQLDLSLWDATVDFDDDDIFAEADAMQSAIDGKEGDSLHRAAADICVAQMPECANEISMLQLMYSQRIKSDCTAYENSLKQQKNASAQKLAAAEKALRDAALDQFRAANKYDLGQCTVEFKNCMITTAGCGDDFSKCASVSALDNTNVTRSTSRKARNYTIKGNATSIEISASTYDTLLAKKPLCESVTNSCVAVKDQVWDTFLREAAPQIKSAELIAEDSARQNCIGSISECFQKACKDTMDPNDPDGSYDMCLSRPAAMLNLCKIPLNACGIDTAKINADGTTKESDGNYIIWEYVVARLASMRVDSCTTEVKQCLQADDRCGKDYSQCVGLDTDSIIKLCPYDKLVGCQKVYGQDNIRGDAVYDELANLVQGIMLNIDNALLTQCQNAANEAMIKVCGGTQECTAFDNDDQIGTESLLSYKDNNDNYVIEGLLSFGNVKVKLPTSTTDDVKFGTYEIDINDYKSHLEQSDPVSDRVINALQSAANKINQKIAIISQDPKVQMCVEGRNMTQVNRRADPNEGRFPHLLDSSVMMIINAGLDRANKNYTKKYDALVAEALESQNDAIKSATCAAMASNPDSQLTCADDQMVDGVCQKFEYSNPFENLFKNSNAAGLSGDGYALRYTITGASLNDLATAAASGHGEFVQTDEYGNMLGNISIMATYSSATNSCVLTTTTTACEDAEKIITRDTISARKVKKGGASITMGDMSVSGKKLKGITMSREHYNGTVCTKYAEPIVTTNNIKM